MVNIPNGCIEQSMSKDNLTVDINDNGQRLDTYLASKTTLSRSNIQKMIKNNNITVNGKLAKSSQQVCIHDKITIDIPPPCTSDIVAENIPLDIIFQDNCLSVINKSTGMVVHPAVGNNNNTLVNALLHHCQDLSGINGELRPGIVHRLDKDTSGVMVVAKTDQAHISLAKQIENKTAERIYIALVFGNVKNDFGEIITNIGRDPQERKKMAVLFGKGKYAHTTYKVLERFGEYTLISCRLNTGRTHQIRVHLSHLGHPLVGDEKYTSRSNKFGVKTQLLHSSSLSFIHPALNNKVSFYAKLPDLFLKTLKNLRKNKKR